MLHAPCSLRIAELRGALANAAGHRLPRRADLSLEDHDEGALGSPHALPNFLPARDLHCVCGPRTQRCEVAWMNQPAKVNINR